MEHIKPIVEKVMMDSLIKALEGIQIVCQQHNDMLKDCVKGIDALYTRVEALERKVYNEM